MIGLKIGENRLKRHFYVIRDKCLFTFQNSPRIFNIFDFYEEIKSQETLADMTTMSSGSFGFFMLERNGWIWFKDLESFFGEDCFEMDYLENFEDSTAISLFYSHSDQSLRVDHTTHSCSKYQD